LLLVVFVVGRSANGHNESANHAKPVAGTFAATPTQWATFTVVPTNATYLSIRTRDGGKVAVNEDGSTLIFSPYSGRVTKLLVKPGDTSNAADRCSSSKPPTWCKRKMISSSYSRR